MVFFAMFANVFTFVLVWTTALACGCSHKEPPRTTRRQNILLFVVDDWGWNDWGVHGSNEMRTCNLDAFAYRSVILNNHYSQALCTPSRVAFMTGKYPARLGMQHDVLIPGEPRGLQLNETILAQCLKNDGYATYAVGKWHLGDCLRDLLPSQRGFDYHLGYWEGVGDYYRHSIGVPKGYDFHINTTPDLLANGTYSTDLYTEKAVELIMSHDTRHPMFMYVAQQNVHAPLQAPANATNQFPFVADSKRRTFDGMLLKMDQSFGEIIDALQRRDMLENTIVMVFADNGGATNGYDGSAGSNWPLKGCKGNYFQGGCRTNAMIWSSDLSHRTSRIENQLMHLVDWFPTILDAVGSSCLRNGVLDSIDGVSMWPVLKGEKKRARNEIFLQKDPISNQSAYIEGDYKLLTGSWNPNYTESYGPVRQLIPPYNICCVEDSKVGRAFRAMGRYGPSIRRSLELRAAVTLDCSIFDCYDNCKRTTKCVPCNPINSTCLYNLKEDPCELINIAEDRPDIVARLLKKIQAFPDLYPLNRPRDSRAVEVWNQFGGVITPWCDYVDCGDVQ